MAEEDERIKPPSKAATFKCSLILYKGMYKSIQKDRKVSIKLFDGEKWIWFNTKFKYWKFPQDAQILSPTIVIHKDYVMVHVPVKREIEDITPIKERMKNENVRICGIAFANIDKVATCVVIDKTGKIIKTLFVSGGNEYKHEITKILNRKKRNI